MASDNNNISFGKYLAGFRISEGLLLEDVSAATKISVKVLSNIEKENHEQLPSPAVVRGFLRLYADFVGADKEVVIEGYYASLHERDTAAEPRGIFRRGSTVWIRTLLYFGVLACIVLVSVYFSSEKAEPPENNRPGIRQKDLKRKDAVMKTTGQKAAGQVGSYEVVESPAPVKHRLLIQAVHETWIKIIIDDKPAEKYTLAPGDRLELEALSIFNVLIGDAGGVELTLNEKPVNLLGKRGQLTTLQLP